MNVPTPDRPGALSAGEVDHFVVTRFSAVPAPNLPPASQEWLDYRLGFFIDVCLPSMQAQSDRDFTWLVWFDDRCSDDFRADIEDLAQGIFEPVWSHAVFRSDLPAQLAARATTSWLLTTRLDSDDAVGFDFIASIHRELRPVDRLVIDFPWGCQVDRSGTVYGDHMQSNHFASLLERRSSERPLTVFATAHPKLRTIAPTRRVSTGPMWLEVVHGGNLLNDVRGLPISPTVIAQRFVINLPYREHIDPATLRRERLARARVVAATMARNPHRLLAGFRAISDHVRGSYDVPQQTGPTAGERLLIMRARLRRTRP